MMVGSRFIGVVLISGLAAVALCAPSLPLSKLATKSESEWNQSVEHEIYEKYGHDPKLQDFARQKLGEIYKQLNLTDKIILTNVLKGLAKAGVSPPGPEHLFPAEKIAQRIMDDRRVKGVLYHMKNPPKTLSQDKLAAMNAKLKEVNIDHNALYYWVMWKMQSIDGLKEYVPCLMDLWSLLGGIASAQMWALQMVDAGTKLPSGLLAGNIVDLGQYDECIAIKSGNITGQHCLISFTFSLPQSDGSDILSMLGGSLTLTLSMCVPATCTPNIMHTAMNDVAAEMTSLLTSMNVSVVAKVPDTDCHTEVSRSGPDATDIAILFIIILLLLTAGISTSLDYLLVQKNVKDRRPSPGEVAIQAFSFLSNGRKLFSLKQNPDQMNCISGMKFLSIGWVAIGHRYRFAVTIPLVNLLTIADMIQTVGKMVILNGILSVDTFFLISGLLNAYGFSILRDRARRFNIFNVLHLYLHRFIRLSPSYLLMIGMTATWLYRVGDGPIWDRMVGEAKDSCRESWWANIIYLNNYLTPDKNCMMQSWYLAADMQMFVFAPLILIPLYSWPIVGYVLLGVFGFLSVLSPFLVAYFYDITTPIPITTNEAQQSKEMDKLYFPTHTKTISYVIGIYIGYILYRIRVKKNMRFNINLWKALVGWIVAGVCLLYALFGGHPLFLDTHPYTLLESSLYIGFYRLFWSVGVAWVIFACTLGWGGIINTFLSLPIFGPLGRLSYCIYLTHVFMILYKMGSTRTAVYFSDYDMLQESLGEMVIIIGFATLLSLVSESPVVTLEKLIMSGGGGKRRREKPRPEPTAPLAQEALTNHHRSSSLEKKPQHLKLSIPNNALTNSKPD